MNVKTNLSIFKTKSTNYNINHAKNKSSNIHRASRADMKQELKIYKRFIEYLKNRKRLKESFKRFKRNLSTIIEE